MDNQVSVKDLYSQVEKIEQRIQLLQEKKNSLLKQIPLEHRKLPTMQEAIILVETSVYDENDIEENRKLAKQTVIELIDHAAAHGNEEFMNKLFNRYVDFFEIEEIPFEIYMINKLLEYGNIEQAKEIFKEYQMHRQGWVQSEDGSVDRIN